MECKVCGTDKSSGEFYKKDSTCKECRKEKVRENRRKNIDYYREYDKTRFQNDPRVKARHERYLKSESGRESSRMAKYKWAEKNKIKRAVHIVTGNAIRSGALRKMPCENCGEKEVHAHHDDYAKPLDVRWLCPSCHKKWHAENGEGKNAT